MHGGAGPNQFECGGGVVRAWHVSGAEVGYAYKHGCSHVAGYRNSVTLEGFVGNWQGIWGHASSNQCVNGIEMRLYVLFSRTHGARLVCEEVHNISIPEAGTAVKHRKKQEAI
jgi:hypothetical protein